MGKWWSINDVNRQKEAGDMTPIERQLHAALQHFWIELITCAIWPAKEVEESSLVRILGETAVLFPECSRAMLTGAISELPSVIPAG